MVLIPTLMKLRFSYRRILKENTLMKEEIAELESEQKIKTYQLMQEQEKIKEMKSEFDAQKAQLKEELKAEKSSLSNEFKVIATDIIKQNKIELEHSNIKGIQSILSPLQEKINNFESRVNTIHTDSVKSNQSLETQIESLKKHSYDMQKETSDLTSALKGNSQMRGAWGEVQLEKTLEYSGLVKGDHYSSQTSFKDDENKTKITDYLVKLPNNKHIIIDSKVSLIDYNDAMAADSVESRNSKMKLHVESVKRHIKDLHSKDYAKLNNINAPDYVLMFMPIESSYIDALKYDDKLFMYGYNKNVILVSHTTLIPIIRTVANIWILDKNQSEAEEISSKAGDIYNAVYRLTDNVLKLGTSLNAASNHYNNTVTSISGRSGIQKSVEKFKQIPTKIKSDIPEIDTKSIVFNSSLVDVQPLVPEDKPQAN